MTSPRARWEVIHGDCLTVMRAMPAASVDAVVTDPPYGLAFMGKAWDDPRSMTRVACEECGNDDACEGYRYCSDCLPKMAEPKPAHGGKSMLGHVSKNWKSKGTHSRGYADNDNVAFQKAMNAWAVEALRVAKPGAHLLAFGGTRTFHRLTCAIEDAGWEIRDCLSWLYGSGFPKSHNGPWGGTALKPAWEPVVLARKPLIGTVAANHAAHGTGALNIDGCRIATTDTYSYPNGPGGNVNPTSLGLRKDGTSSLRRETPVESNPLGRWPANVCLDAEAAAALDEQSGVSRSRVGEPRGAASGDGWGMTATGAEYDDLGGASRFFYTAKASRSEREAGLTGERVECQSGMGGAMPTDDTGRERDRFKVTVRNTHPTVKPVDLMRWLVRLVTPVGGTVLDPFLGSGTTGVAALEEGCRFIGIEREAEYVAIARARIEAAARAPMLDFGASS